MVASGAVASFVSKTSRSEVGLQSRSSSSSKSGPRNSRQPTMVRLSSSFLGDFVPSCESLGVVFSMVLTALTNNPANDRAPNSLHFSTIQSARSPLGIAEAMYSGSGGERSIETSSTLVLRLNLLDNCGCTSSLPIEELNWFAVSSLRTAVRYRLSSLSSHGPVLGRLDMLDVHASP